MITILGKPLPEVTRFCEAIDDSRIALNINAVHRDAPMHTWVLPEMPEDLAAILRSAFAADMVAEQNRNRPAGAIWPAVEVERLSDDAISYLQSNRERYAAWSRSQA